MKTQKNGKLPDIPDFSRHFCGTDFFPAPAGEGESQRERASAAIMVC